MYLVTYLEIVFGQLTYRSHKEVELKIMYPWTFDLI